MRKRWLQWRKQVEEKIAEAKSREVEKERREKERPGKLQEDAVEDPGEPEIHVDNTKEDSEFVIPEKEKVKQNRMVLRNLAKECDRWGVSNRAGAAIANAVLIDAGVITSEDQTNVIDKNKLRRSREEYRNERQVKEIQQLEENQGHAYYFDGKKTMSLCVEEDEQGKKYNIMRELELISMSAEPGGLYVTHLEPKGGKGVEVAEAVLGFLREHNLDASWLIVGTAANTGKHIGAFASLEKMLDRRLLWVLCMLHLNELPWRHIFVALDGPTSSHNTFLGVIGKILPNVEYLEWSTKVEKVQLGPGLPELPEEVAADLSSDQRILYLAFMSVWTGVIREELYSLTPGPISHSRWLTHCTRTLICHLKEHGLKGKPKKDLMLCVKFLVSNYVPMWFACKQHVRITDGPKHLHTQRKLLKVVKEPVLSIAKKNIAQNAYWAHPEVLLVAMLADKNQSIRSKAVEEIIKLRGDSDLGDDQPRLYHVPQLKFTAKCYSEMIDWKLEVIYEPVLTVKMSMEELLALKDSPLIMPRYSSNTQSVERLVKQTSRAASSVAGFEARDGFLRASATSRILLPKFESKRDFENNFV